MITITIGTAQATFDQADDAWINQQINRRRADGAVICVQVSIQESDVNVVLRTPACGAGGGGGRLPNPREKQVFDLWNARHLNEREFTGGDVVSFLRQLRRIL